MAESRPDPDALLARVNAEASRLGRGKLKIFFGAAPGVGKTYTMLEAAREEGQEGHDVVPGYLERHVQPETAALVLGLDIPSRRKGEYRGAVLQEFDLDAALARKPKLLIVDELAHTNAPGATHAKRWQDVEQLLQAGIDVYTTLNVQHLESLNDVVAQIIGTTVRETVPDSVFDAADEIELVDIAPDDLVERLREGKVYIEPQAERAIQNFFRKGNLIALRELALRRTAERVNLQMESYRTEHALRPVPTSERLLVCIGPSPFAGRLIRATRRMAASLKAPWVAIHVETPATVNLSPVDRTRLSQNLLLAEQLGGETVTLSGASVVEEVIAYAKRRNVSKIIAGKSQVPRWRELLFGSFVYELTRRCGDIDVYIISGEAEEERPTPGQQAMAPRPRGAYAWSLAIVAACTGVGLLVALPAHLDPEPATLVNIVMVYLVGIMVS